ncbi:VPS16 protein, partial [Rissa tridactyla]|nr:VPS16 protein [Chroicocephalus maculipennis]NXV33497.1 VPS16 protein [Rissa tridactyla]
EVLQNHVLEAKVFHTEYGTGVAILTGAHRFSLTTNIDDLKLRRMPEVPGLQKPPSCWAVLSQDRVTIVLLAVGQDLYLLDNTSCSVVVSELWWPVTGSRVVCSPPHSLAGPSPVPCCPMGCFPAPSTCWQVLPSTVPWEGVYSRDIWPHPVQGQRGDVPGLGQPLTCFFFPVFAEASQEIFKIASMAPGALLLEAQKEYEKESQKADEYLREIKDQKLLPEAVSQCIEAAGYEHEPDTQKSLLRAASFGKCFIDKFPPESFVRMCQDLRVLNAIRDYQIGIPLTFTQYKRLTIEVLLDRLVLRRLYPLAIRICEYLRLSEIQGVSRILAHWACYKVQQKDKSDEEVAHAINQKLGDTPGISYSEIAARAYDCGRTELAIKLLEYEPRSGEQVPLLLKMKRSKLALSKAIESGDTDLVYTVVLHLKNELNRGTFFMTLQNQPVALSLYRQFCKHQERETLKDLYNQDDNHQELGNFHVHSSYS